MESKSVVKLIGLVLVLGLGLSGLNMVTAPIIEKNSAAGEFEPLYTVMPDAQGFEIVEGLNDVDEKVTGVYKETSGLGYVVQLSTSEGYTKEPIEFTLAFDMEGKISNIHIISNPETKDWGDGYPETYIGQDSTMADVQLVAGVTYASSALKNATAAAFDTLINNDLLSAGQMGPEQILTNVMMEKFSAMKSASGAAQYEEISAEGFTKAYQALNGSGYGLISVEGDDGYLVLVNTKGNYAVYDINGDLVENDELGVKAAASVAVIEASSKDVAKLAKLADVDESALVPVSMEGIFNTVTDVYKIGDNYGFIVKSYGFKENMTEYFLLNSEGEIVKMTVDAILQEADYFSVKVDADSYKNGFVGLNEETFDGSQALIAGATISTGAITSATNDVFEAYRLITGGYGE